jgi:hypothetical protein
LIPELNNSQLNKILSKKKFISKDINNLKNKNRISPNINPYINVTILWNLNNYKILSTQSINMIKLYNKIKVILPALEIK